MYLRPGDGTGGGDGARCGARLRRIAAARVTRCAAATHAPALRSPPRHAPQVQAGAGGHAGAPRPHVLQRSRAVAPCRAALQRCMPRASSIGSWLNALRPC